MRTINPEGVDLRAGKITLTLLGYLHLPVQFQDYFGQQCHRGQS